MVEVRPQFLHLLRYVVVGGVNTLLAFGVFVLFLKVGCHFSVATLAGGICGMVMGFKLHGTLVFGHSGRGRFLWFLAIFVSMYGLSLGIQTLARGSVNGYLAGAVASCVTVPVSYLLNRTFVFQDRAVDSRPRS